MATPLTILEQGEGVLHMTPNWVPRSFCIPGRRLKLHPDDLYSFGVHRGGIDERWFSSTVHAENGALALWDEGLSYVAYGEASHPQRILFKEIVEDLGEKLLGADLWGKYQSWPVFAKFFDNRQALPFHLHHRNEHAELVGANPKPEAYFFPTQMNNYPGEFPYTFFGLEPDTSPEELKQCLRVWNNGDNGILHLSRAFRLQLGTGWDIPAGILHAPGSLCTFEPQWASDIAAMFQSLVNDAPTDWGALTHYVPEDKKQDLDFIISLIDWEANTNPNFKKDRFLLPQPVRVVEEMLAEGYHEDWIVYGSDLFSGKELTVFPGTRVTITDSSAYGFIAVQGHGTFGAWQVETPSVIRFGQVTNDEFFVSEAAARAGIRISNPSQTEALVLLKYFGPGAH
jgi:hypothetical protein